jgi:membrane fusion protein, multidrug efflux system
MKRWQKRLLWGGVALVVLGLLAWPKVRPAETAAAGSTPGARGPQALTVTAYVVDAVPMRDRIRATGTLQADESVDLSSETSGRVTRIHFQEGSRVTRGQLLLTINDAELQAQRERLRYRIELAETREQRQRRLLEIGGVSRDEYDGVLGELNVLRADLQLVEAQLARTQVRAPFSGIIGLRHVSEGAYVTPQTRIATLQALSPMKLEFSIPERYSGRIRLGHPVVFNVAGSPATYRGEVYAVEPRVSVDTRTLLIRARVPNTEGTLMPGAFADLELIVEEIDQALPVPAMAVTPELAGPRVWVVENGRATARSVETGLRTDTAVQVTAGLAPGDTVLVSGLQAIRPGQPVRITEMATLGDVPTQAASVPVQDAAFTLSSAP